MTISIPDSHRDLVDDANYVDLATVMPDGQPQLSVVWCSYDGEHLLVNTAVGRQKEKNMRNRPQATVLAVDPSNPFRYLEIRGTVELTEEGALDHINSLAKLYRGYDSYYGNAAPAEMAEKETRIIAKITPTRIIAFPQSR